MKVNPEKPDCLSIIICDDVYRDEHTKKMVVVGTFNNINTSTFPCRHPRLTVLFTLTNAVGDYSLSMRIEHEKTGRVIMEMEGPFHVDSPLMISDVNVQLGQLIFHEEGKHWVVLAADGAILAQRPFFVSLQKNQGREPDSGG